MWAELLMSLEAHVTRRPLATTAAFARFHFRTNGLGGNSGIIRSLEKEHEQQLGMIRMSLHVIPKPTTASLECKQQQPMLFSCFVSVAVTPTPCINLISSPRPHFLNPTHYICTPRILFVQNSNTCKKDHQVAYHP